MGVSVQARVASLVWPLMRLVDVAGGSVYRGRTMWEPGNIGIKWGPLRHLLPFHEDYLLRAHVQ